MDRHPQQIKRERQDVKRRAKNISDMSRLRTQIKRVLNPLKKIRLRPNILLQLAILIKLLVKVCFIKIQLEEESLRLLAI